MREEKNYYSNGTIVLNYIKNMSIFVKKVRVLKIRRIKKQILLKYFKGRNRNIKLLFIFNICL